MPLVPPTCRLRRSRAPVIGPVGARRTLALLVIGDAVLGGLVVGVLLRSGDDPPSPVRAVTSTTTSAQGADAAPASAFDPAPAIAPGTTTSVVPPSATTTATTAPSASPSTVASAEPRVAAVTTTVAPTVPPTTTTPSTTVAPPVEGDD